MTCFVCPLLGAMASPTSGCILRLSCAVSLVGLYRVGLHGEYGAVILDVLLPSAPTMGDHGPGSEW